MTCPFRDRLWIVFTFVLIDHLSTMELFKEKDDEMERLVLDFIANCKPPSVVLTDVGRAIYYYNMYEKDMSLPRISKAYFLYIWLCSRDIKPSNISMRHYKFFDSDRVKV